MRSHSKLFAVFVLIFCFTFAAFGQEPEPDETSRIVIPPAVKAQIVRRILTWYFKPRNQKKVIAVVGDGFEKAWLPKIRGIEFRFLTEEEAFKGNENVYTFTEIEKLNGGRYEIGFGFGSPGSGYIGDSWSIRFSKEKVSLWKKGYAGWGSSGADLGPDNTDK